MRRVGWSTALMVLAMAVVLVSTTVVKAGWVGEDDEFDMDSEINRRILATTEYLSTDMMKKGAIPCSVKGASYYNCRPGAQVNQYTRSCSKITQCRSGQQT